MKFKISITIPDDLASLRLADVAPEVTRTEQALTIAQSALSATKAQLSADAERIEQVRRDIARGTARPSDLQAAIDRQRVTALSIAGYEEGVTAAESALEAALVKARAEFREEALHRHEILVRAAQAVAPLLEVLRDSEAEIDGMIRRETRYTDALGVTRELPPTPALDWPSSLLADAVRASVGMAVPGVLAAPVPSPAPVAAARTEAPVTARTIPYRPQVRTEPDPTSAPDLAPVTETRRAPMTTRVDMPALDFRASVGAVNDDARTVELIFSTGADVVRMDFDGTRYLERLSLQPKHVRLDRLNNGAPLLNSHSAMSLGDQIGVVVEGSARVNGKTGELVVRFPKAADDDAADKIYRKVKDKIIRNVSIGYRVHRVEETPGKNGALAIRTAIDWEPFEVSLVAMGADAGARVRSMNPCEIVKAIA